MYQVVEYMGEPECEVDFCERCGNCLACHGEPCWSGGIDNGPHIYPARLRAGAAVTSWTVGGTVE